MDHSVTIIFGGSFIVITSVGIVNFRGRVFDGLGYPINCQLIGIVFVIC